ncbi:MAG: SpaH/EbpB family LPXTG-anchored major pilin [Clostridiales Family XIII bacterium]|jgi:fimbrial isopeptide formation D2 family protein/LPXTG-motif cell wall-anchored protein|nr:SpaH/EbpB family LPXTG-anchored major pilin [Clostridiales Family XIII bacterium]
MEHKKLLAAALTLAMVFALVSPVFAAPIPAASGSIRITQPNSSVSIAGQAFEVYRIFDLTLDDRGDINNPAGYAYSYTVAPEFKDYAYTVGATTYGDHLAHPAYSSLPAYIGTLSNDSDALNAFAEDVYAWAKGTGAVSPGTTITMDAAGGADAEEKTVSGLPLGYYLVFGQGTATDGSGAVVSAFALDSTSTLADIHIKADVPALDKKVSDAANGTFGEQADLDIGDTAHFKLTSTVPSMIGYDSYTYIVHDTLSEGLTFNDDIAIAVGSNTAFTDFTLDKSGIVAGGGGSFTITFNDFIDLNTGDAIVITYSATLNEKAKIKPTDAAADNVNNAHLEYSNDPTDGTSTGETPDNPAYVHTFEFDVYKYTGTLGSGETKLADAKFKLYTDASASKDNEVPLVLISGSTYRHAKPDELTGITEADPAAAHKYTTRLTSDSNGNIKVEGLDAGTYYLKEIEPPAGYNLVETPIKVELIPVYNTDGTVDTYTIKKDNAGTSKINVENNSGIELPESGGIGRTIFTIVGLLLMLGAGLVLVARRKTAAARAERE